jgi:hypothetical protein
MLRPLFASGACRTLVALGLLVTLGAAAQGQDFLSFGADFDGNGQLYRVDVETALMTPVGPVQPSSPRMPSLATGPDGLLYGTNASASIRLFRINPDTGSIIEVGATGITNPSDAFRPKVAFDGAGSLWLVLGQDLYSIDPATALASPPAALPRAARTLASRFGQLIAITDDGGPTDPHRIEELDPQGPTLTTLSSTSFSNYYDAAFDDQGRMRVLGSSGGIPELEIFNYYVIADLVTAPEPVQTASNGYFFLDIEAGARNLTEIPSGPVPVEVPTAGTLGRWLLAAALLAAALAFLRRP